MKEHTMKHDLVFIDDDLHVLKAIKRVFIAAPYNLHLFSDPNMAITAVSQMQPAAVASDYRMPGIDGLTLLETIKERAPHTARLMLTGHADLETTLAAINRGLVYRYLQKPWNQEALKGHIEDAVAYHELNRSNANVAVDIERLCGARELAIAMCQEMAQPVQLILGNADLLKLSDCAHPHRLEFVDNIESNAKEIRAVLENLNKFHRCCVWS